MLSKMKSKVNSFFFRFRCVFYFVIYIRSHRFYCTGITHSVCTDCSVLGSVCVYFLMPLAQYFCCQYFYFVTVMDVVVLLCQRSSLCTTLFSGSTTTTTIEIVKRKTKTVKSGSFFHIPFIESADWNRMFFLQHFPIFIM